MGIGHSSLMQQNSQKHENGREIVQGTPSALAGDGVQGCKCFDGV